MRSIFLALLILGLFASFAQAAPCESCQRPSLLNGGCQCADCQCAAGECGDLSCPSRAGILGAGPIPSFVQEVRPVRRLAGAVRQAQPVRRVLRGAAAVIQNRPRLLRRFAARVFGGCR